MLCGVPFVDLKAGDEVFANVCLALAEKAHTGRGKRIDVSMAQAAASWLVTTLPLLDLGYSPEEVRRSGNEHREFVPVNVYPTSDGHVYLAIGNDVQWARLTSIEAFANIGSPTRRTNEGRKQERESIHRDIGSHPNGPAGRGESADPPGDARDNDPLRPPCALAASFGGARALGGRGAAPSLCPLLRPGQRQGPARGRLLK